MGIFIWELKSRPNWPRPWAVYYLSLASTLWVSDGLGMDLGGGPGPPVKIKKKKKKTNYIHHFCSWAPSKTLGPSPSSNYPIKILNKNNKNVHNCDCILAKKKKNYFTTKEPKNNVLLEKLKLIFFATTVNRYKYQLTVASC